MTYSATVGSGGTHTDLNAWVAYVVANYVSGGNLTDNVEALITAGGLSVSAQQIISGWNPNGFTTTIKPNTGAGFRDNANARTTNAIYYNTGYGAYLNSTYNSGSSAGALAVRVDKCRIYNLMSKCNGDCPVISFDTNSITDLILEGNMVWSTFAANGAVLLGSNVNGANIFIRNNVMWNERAAGSSRALRIDGNDSSGNKVKVHDNTFWQDTNGSCTVACGSDTYIEAIGNVFLQNTNCALSARDGQTTGSNNATNKSAWDNTGYGGGSITGLTSSQFSITVANEFVDADGTPTDFKLKSGGTQCQGTNITISGISDDITGFARSGSIDIGAYQLSGGGGGGGSVRRMMGLLGVGP